MLLIGVANSADPQPERQTQSYLAASPLPDVVIAVRADTQTCTRRIMERTASGGWPTIIKSADGPDFLRRMNEAYDPLLDAVRMAGVRVIEVENGSGEPLPDLGALVAEALGAAGRRVPQEHLIRSRERELPIDPGERRGSRRSEHPQS